MNKLRSAICIPLLDYIILNKRKKPYDPIDYLNQYPKLSPPFSSPKLQSLYNNNNNYDSIPNKLRSLYESSLLRLSSYHTK
uniref:Putative ovule protein n=1 Tax=Solanum chacoense TaxID=4108 RepID=A0A0V0HEZ7_SOLCH